MATKKNSKMGKKKVKKDNVILETEFELADKHKTKNNSSLKKKFLLLVAFFVLGYLIFVYKGLFIAATVNGYPISRIAIIKKLEEQAGQQVLDALVSEMLITQEARKANLFVTDQEVDDEINRVKGQFKDQNQDLDAILSSQSISQKDFRQRVKVQLLFEKLVSGEIEVTAQEIDEFIKTNKSFLPTNLSEEKLKEMVNQELRSQKIADKYNSWISQAKQNSDINYFIEY